MRKVARPTLSTIASDEESAEFLGAATGGVVFQISKRAKLIRITNHDEAARIQSC
jgi:hypothetical protein